MATVETGRDRRVLVRDAGYGTTSFVSSLAGTLVGFGAVALVMTVIGAVGSQLGLRTDGISTHDWRNAGIAGASIATAVLFLSFFLGGYTAGRMARRAGTRHGFLVFLLGVILVAAVIGLGVWVGGNTNVRDTLTSNGVPVDRNTWSDIGTGAAIAAAVAMFLGAVLGGLRGERWHGRLLTAAAEHRHVDEAPDSVVDRPRHELGRDETTIDVRDPSAEPSVEEEREQARTARSDVGL